MTPWNGVVPVDKPAGPTSHDIVVLARRTLGIRRVGHSGTLDPFATGLLLLCLGPATRLSEYLTGLPKSYSARMRLGAATSTDDVDGEVVSTSEAWTSLTRDQVDAALQAQQGRRLQAPPRFSAKKIEGERAYRVARRGGEVDPAPVEVTIDRIALTDLQLPEVAFEVDCSSGTYIRAIARDVGEALGVGAHLTELRRTSIGGFRVERALNPEQFTDPNAVQDALIPPSDAIGHLDRFVAPPTDIERILHGRAVEYTPGGVGTGPVAAISREGDLVAIGSREGSLFRPKKVFA